MGKKAGTKVLFFTLYVLFSVTECFELSGFASQVFTGFLPPFCTLGREGMHHQKGPLQ